MKHLRFSVLVIGHLMIFPVSLLFWPIFGTLLLCGTIIEWATTGYTEWWVAFYPFTGLLAGIDEAYRTVYEE